MQHYSFSLPIQQGYRLQNYMEYENLRSWRDLVLKLVSNDSYCWVYVSPTVLHGRCSELCMFWISGFTSQKQHECKYHPADHLVWPCSLPAREVLPVFPTYIPPPPPPPSKTNAPRRMQAKQTAGKYRAVPGLPSADFISFRN